MRYVNTQFCHIYNLKLQVIVLLMLCSISGSYAQVDSVLISNAKFQNPKFDNAHAGSGFLLSYEDKIFACTAKHVLFFAKTDSMKSISFGGELKSWSFASKINEENTVTAGKLINENSEEALVMPPKGDWLIFEVKGDIPKGITIYSLREDPLMRGEEVFFLGYPYESENPIRVKGEFIGMTPAGNLSLSVPKGTYNGCSGGPVVDAEGKLVGLVSMGYFNEKENRMVFEPASPVYFKHIIDTRL